MKDLNFKLIIFVSIIIVIGCSSVKNKLILTDNKGGYVITIENKSDIDQSEIRFVGKVFDVSNEEPIANAELVMGCLKTKTSLNGEYSFEIVKSDLEIIFIKGQSVGYKTIETNFLNTENNNSVKIDFYLVEDNRPLINCEGLN